MVAGKRLLILGIASLAITVVSSLSMVRAADEPLDMRRIQSLHARVQKGEVLSPADQTYYDRGKIEWQRQHQGRRASAEPNSTRPRRPESDPLTEVGVQRGQEFAVSETVSPLETVETTSAKGVKVIGVMRKPPGTGPFPAIINLHGGLRAESMSRLRGLVTQPTMSRFLAAGYLVVAPTFRDRESDPQTRDALDDCLTMIDWVKRRPDVDPNSVVVWGDSGGGSLALELAGEADLAAVAAQEPATILMIGIMTKENSNKGALMQDPKRFWTPAQQTFTREKISKIHCPVFIAYGDKSQINHVNHEIVIPELKAAGKPLETKLYPGQRHGFSKASKEFFDDASRFFAKYLKTTPKPISQK